jgi:hypothetical protein
MRLFDPIENNKEQKEEKVERRMNYKYSFYALLLSIILGAIGISILNNYTMTKKKETTQIVEMDNNYIMTEKVEYGKPNSADPEDTSHIWYQVMNAPDNSKWKKGDLVSAIHYTKKEYDGTIVYLIHQSNVLFGIRKENIKK